MPSRGQMTKSSVDAAKLRDLGKALLTRKRLSPDGWFWIGDRHLKRLSKKRANKFLFACIIDYQMKTEKIWDNCERFIENELGDPESLREVVANMKRSRWLELTKTFGLHRFPKAHDRLWRIGRLICQRYDGDARLIWRNRNASEVLGELEALGVGPNLSRMTVGGLIDTNWVST